MPKTFRENLREELDYQDMKVKELAVATGIPKPTLDCYLSARQVIPPPCRHCGKNRAGSECFG